MENEKNLLTSKPKTMKVVKLIPPDGGWGWMVLLGSAVTNVVNQSMLSLFSLLYGGALQAMGHNTEGAAIVMSIMLFVANFGGPIAGAIIKLTSARFMAVTGACICTLGIFLSGFSTNIVHLMLTYGVLLGFGLGSIQNSVFTSINSYFKLKKSRAVGLANVGTGVGQTVMPYLVSYLLANYDFRSTCMLLSALSLHGIAGTLLLQPVDRHMKKVEEEIEIDEKQQLLINKHSDIVINKSSISYGDEKTEQKNRRVTEPDILNGGGKNGWNGKISQSNAELNMAKQNTKNEVKLENATVLEGKVQKMNWFRKLYDLFGLTLLSSPRFLNIILGTALATTSIQNFSMLYPLFLQNYAQLDIDQTARCMSAVAAADIVGRLLLPIVQDKFKIKARWMFIMTCIWLIVIRQIMAYQSEYSTLIAMSGLYGFGRSMIIIARPIAISENCRMDQVPAAVGLGMLAMGILVPPVGLFLGWIRDYTDSYLICITAQNCLLVILLVTWIPDMLYIWLKDKHRSRKDIELIENS